jgi:uncharacterized protein
MALDADTRESLRSVLATEPAVAAAYVFGSVARGEATASSDLDVAILLRAQAPGHRDRDLDARLAELAGRLERFAPSGRVDLVVLGEQGPIFRHAVLREGVLVHEGDRELRLDFEGRTYSEYLDWKPTHDLAMAAVLEGLRDRFARGVR